MNKKGNHQTSVLKKSKELPGGRPFVSIVVPAFNEAAIIENNLDKLCQYMSTIENDYRWELIVINDGSMDETGTLADHFSEAHENVRVLHHMFNARIGQAFKTAFKTCEGDYVVTMDLDLSYSPDHIGKLLTKMVNTGAEIVIASPYMKGGRLSNVPMGRRILSRWANRFLSFFVKTPFNKLTTLTGMVRAYNREFLSELSLRATDVDIHCEIVHKAVILGARIDEIPAHLNWYFAKMENYNRKSSMRIFKSIALYLTSGFLLRPFIFFFAPGIILFGLSIYALFWAAFHTISAYGSLMATTKFITFPVSESISAAFTQSPHSFIIGGLSFIIAIQLIGLGFLSLQNNRYYEDLFYLGSRYRQ
jgi:glycosyltransferase involved in cell wall biosynthesis